MKIKSPLPRLNTNKMYSRNSAFGLTLIMMLAMTVPAFGSVEFFDDFEDSDFSDRWDVVSGEFSENNGSIQATVACQHTGICPSGPGILRSKETISVPEGKVRISFDYLHARSDAAYTLIEVGLSQNPNIYLGGFERTYSLFLNNWIRDQVRVFMDLKI